MSEKQPLYIGKVAVIGAGVMGAGIAANVATAGIPVVLLDIVPPGLSDEDKASGLTEDSSAYRNTFSRMGKERVCHPKKGVICSPEMAGYITVGNLEDDLGMLEDCDWIVEVIIENLEAKKALFAKIAPFCKGATVISSNTSGVSITRIAEDMPEDFRSRFLGTHFFNPPRYMHLLELIPGKDSTPEIMDFMAGFASRILGKGVVRAKDSPGFIANRIGSHAFAAALRAMEMYGFSIDKMDKLGGSIIGRPPSANFRTLDMVGLDIYHNVVANMFAVLDDAAEKAMFTTAPIVQQLIDNNQLGDKTKAGFYTKTKDGTRLVFDNKTMSYQVAQDAAIPVLQEAKAQGGFKEQLSYIIDSQTPEGDCVWYLVKSSLLYSAQKAGDIADDIKNIDLAMKWGYNWAVGPFELWDALGLEKIARRMQAEGEQLPDWIVKLVEAGTPSLIPKDAAPPSASLPTDVITRFEDATLIVLGDGILCLEMRPKGNAITTQLENAIRESVSTLNDNPAHTALVLYNPGKNFLNGADLVSIAKTTEAGDWLAMESRVSHFQGTSLVLRYSRKPVVAAVRGMVLGGGLEYAMHCARIVASLDTFMGLVESGVGLVPAGGGVKECLIRAMQKAEVFNMGVLQPLLRKVWDPIARARVSKNAFDARNMGFLKATDRIIMNDDLLLATAKEEAMRMTADGYRQALSQSAKITGDTGRGYLESSIEDMRLGGFISEYDAVIYNELAWVLTGGEAPRGTMLNERQLMELEHQSFMRLLKNQKTQERIQSLLSTGKAARN